MASKPMRRGQVSEFVRANIRRLRDAQKLTTAALAEKMTAAGRPIFQNTVTMVEVGRRRVDVDDLVAFANALGVPPERLLAPFACPACGNSPPAGFICAKCGAESIEVAEQ